MFDTKPLSEMLFDGLLVDPRDYQKRICSKAVNMFAGQYEGLHGIEPAAHSVLIESPTGSGKTVMGLTIARHMQTVFGVSVGWVAMRRNLLRQAKEENVNRGFNVDMQVISMFDKAPPKVDLLVVDEAQHDAAASMANLHCEARPDYVLGLSATPFRTDRIKLCFEKVIRDAGIAQLIEGGYLSQYHHYTIPKWTPETVVDCYTNDPERWGRSLMFFHRNDQCYQANERLLSAGYRSSVVTAQSNRERQLEDFEAGKLDVLINMAILTEGFDCPSLKTVFCRPSGKGCTIQMAGRVFRQYPELPFKQVVQSEDCPYPVVRIAPPKEQYTWVGDAWRALCVNANIGSITANSLRLLAQTEASLPKYVASRRIAKPAFKQMQDYSLLKIVPPVVSFRLIWSA